jgi:squalene synthase HpnC
VIVVADVITDLAIWGPGTITPAPSVVEANRYCRELATSHYENFTVVSWFLPPELRQHMYNIYAFCRWSDDLGDETGDTARSTELLAWWRNELQRCFTGQASHPVYVALRPTIERFHLDPKPFEDLISAFQQDQRVTEYDTFDQLRDYCRRSADPVGRLVLKLFEQSTPEHVAWSDSICTGLQLANFWQDVTVDWAKDRVYLPQDLLARHGSGDRDIAGRNATPGFRAAMAEAVEEARRYFREGWPLSKTLQPRLALDIALFSRGGMFILDKIERQNWDVLRARPKISKTERAALLFRGLMDWAVARAA